MRRAGRCTSLSASRSSPHLADCIFERAEASLTVGAAADALTLSLRGVERGWTEPLGEPVYGGDETAAAERAKAAFAAVLGAPVGTPLPLVAPPAAVLGLPSRRRT